MEKIKTDYNRRRSSFNTCLKLILIGLSIFSCQVTQIQRTSVPHPRSRGRREILYFWFNVLRAGHLRKICRLCLQGYVCNYTHTRHLEKKVSIKVYQLQFPQGAKKANSNYDVIITIAKRFASMKRHSIVRFSCRAGELHEDRSAESVWRVCVSPSIFLFLFMHVQCISILSFFESL